MSIKALPATLKPGLTGRDAIADSIYRCVVALDTDNPALFESAFTKDASFDLNGNVMKGFEAIKTNCYAGISKLDTNHFITNLRINVLDGESKAEVTCSALAQHYRPGEGMKPGATPLLAGSLYWLDIIKDNGDGLWKIQNWILKSNWGQGDWSVFGQ